MPTSLRDFVTLCLSVRAAVMRCLGVPSRCVSNFDSAHDTEANLTVDIYLNEKGEKMNNISFDSVWYCQMELTLPVLPCSTPFPSPTNSFENFSTAWGLLPWKERKPEGSQGYLQIPFLKDLREDIVTFQAVTTHCFSFQPKCTQELPCVE